jgi:hypothetical protein
MQVGDLVHEWTIENFMAAAAFCKSDPQAFLLTTETRWDSVKPRALSLVDNAYAAATKLFDNQ